MRQIILDTETTGLAWASGNRVVEIGCVEMLERRPEEVIRRAVKGMLPRNRLARRQITKLKVYAGPDHPHAAQKPTELETDA